MKIAYNPKTAAALTTAPANNDITFDLSGLSIYVKGVRFKGTDTTYSVFKKHGSSGGGYDGLVPVPSYNNDSKNRYLREDGTWLLVAVTDLNVLLSETTATLFRPIVFGLTYDTSASNLAKSVTGLVYVTTKMYALPSTGYLYATKLFSGGKEVLTGHLSLADYVTLKTNLTITGVKTFSTLLQFTVGLGTSPFTVTSTTKVANLNADLLDGIHESSFYRHRGSYGKSHTASSTDYNLGPGTYSTSESGYSGTLLSFNSTGSASALQFWTHYSQGNLYYRTSVDSNRWGKTDGAWTQILDSDNYTNYTVTKTGGGASGTWGINISGNAATATKASYARALLGRTTEGNDYNAVDGNLIYAEWDTYSDTRWYLKAKGYECRVGYANNSDKVDGYHVGGSDKPWGQLVLVRTDGVAEIGKYIDFHYDNTTGSDYSTRLQCTGNHSNIVSLPSASGTLALTSQIPSVTNYYWANVKVASTANTQTNPSFASVTLNHPTEAGSSRGVLKYYAGRHGWGDYFISDSNGPHISLLPASGGNVYLDSTTIISGNVGIGVVPLQKLHVDGIVRISSSGCAHLYLKADSDVVDLYSIIRFGINGNDNASYIFQNGPKRTNDGGANAMTIRNNVGILRLQNRVHIDSTGRIYPEGSSSRRTGMYGVYDSTKIGHIWSMGTSYMIPDDGSTFGNLYGLAYKHTNNSTGGTMAGGHLVVWCDAGNPKVSLGYNGVWVSGGFYKNGSSDSYVLLGGGGHKSISSIINGGYIGTTQVLTTSLNLRITGISGIHLVEGNGISFREGNPSYYTTLRYDTYGNEALILGMKNSVTSFIVKSGDSGATNNTTTTFNNLTPSIQVKGLSLYVNSLISNGTTPGYNFYVAGTSKFTNTVRISTVTGSYCEGLRLLCADGLWQTIILGATGETGTNANAWSIHRKSDNNFCISRNSSDGSNGLVMTSIGMGLGTTAPNYRLHVAGTTYTSATIGVNRSWLDNGLTSAVGPITMMLTIKGMGYPVYDDPEFANSTNGVSVYNNNGNGTVTISRIADNLTSSNSSGYILQISTSTGTASPGRGGFIQHIPSRANAVFVLIFRAKIPTGFSVVNAENSQGSGAAFHWLTSREGTGKWEWYIRVTHCGSSGSFSGGGHVYLSGSGAVTWYLSYCNLIDITKGNYDGLRTKYSDTATYVSNTYVMQHTSNNVEYPLIWSNLNNSNSVLGNLLHKSYSHLTYNPSLRRVIAGLFYANNASGPHFTGVSTSGNWAYLRLNNSTCYWDIATKNNSGSGGLWLARYNGNDNGIFVSTGSNIGIGNSAPADKLDVTGNIRTTRGSKYMLLRLESDTWSSFYTNASQYYFDKSIYVNGAIWRYNTNYGIDSNGYFYSKGVYANRDGSSTLGGVSLYSNSDPMTYGIAFRGTGTYGTHGYVTAANDWATYLTMNDSTTRGWIFRRGSTNVFSIAGSGDAYANGLISSSRFISRVATGTQPYACTSTTVNTNLNADLLDGLHGSDFTRTQYGFSSTSDNSMTSCTDFATWVSRLSSGYGILGTSSITTGAWWWVRSIDLQVNGWNIRTSGAMIIHAGDGNTSNKNYKHFLILDAYSDLYGITSNEESHKKYARFLNSNNYTSYVNPKATSKTIWGLTYIDASGNFLNVNGLLYVTANGNTTTIGSLNGSWCHIYNSANVPFIFNKSIHTIGSIYPYDNNTHQLGGSSNKWKHLYLSNRAYLDEWIQFSGATGLYWPNTNGAHLYANTKTSYGGLITLGSRGGYCGLHCGPDNTYMTVMSSADHLGLYNESKGRWSFYYNRPNDRISIYNSSTDLGYGVQINQRTGIKINSYPSLHLVRTDAGETSMYFSNNTAGWAIGINPWSVGAGLFAIGLYSGTGSSHWRFRIDNNGYCFTSSYLNLGAGNEKNASNPPYVWGVNGSDNYLRTYATSSLRVSYASSASDADKLDGEHGTRYTRALGSPNYITINVGGNANTYYPVVISNVSDYYPMQLVNISRLYYETAPDTWNTSTHRGGLTLTLLWNGSRYWDGNSSGGACYCVYKNETYSTMVGGLGNATGGKVVWLRGGGAVYHIHSMNGTSTTATVYTSTYTDSANQSFAPKTSTDSVSVRWPGYAQGADYATSAGNADTVDGQHFNWNNNKNDHTYLWAASSNGQAYLVHRASMSVNYASSAGSASTVTVNSSDANSTYRMVWHSGNTLYGTNNIYCNPYSDQIYSAGFRHVSYNSASYLLRSDGGAAAFNWSGQSGQPTWLWGGNSQHTYYVYNPSNFNVNSAAVLRGNASNPNNSHPGHGAKVFYSWNVGKVGNDTSGYSNGITIGSHPNDTAYGFQIVQNMWDDRTYTRRYNGGWQSWKTLAWTSDIPTVTNYYWANIKVSASSSTSTSPTFATATMTRGVVGGYNNTSYALSTSSFICQSWIRTTGSTGWYNESYGGGWNMTDTTYIRVYGSKRVYNDNTSQYAFYTSGGMTALGHMYSASSSQSWLNGQKEETAALNIAASSNTGSYWPWFRQTLTAASKWISVGTLGNSLYFIGSATSRTANSYDYGFRMDFSNGYLYGNFSGSLSGNASSATKLTTSAGSAALPIYFSDGKPVACTASSVFSNLSNDGNSLSITVAGLNRKLIVNYASNAAKVSVTDSSTAYKILGANGNGNLSIYRLTSTIGGTTKPIYINAGVPTAFSSTVGNSKQPVYLSNGEITLCPYSFYGSSTQPIVLVAGRIYRSSNTAASNDWSFSGYKHESVGNLNSTPSISGGVARFTFNSVSGKTYYFIGAVVNHGTSSEVTSATSGDYSNVRSDGLYWFGTYVSDPYIYIRACCNADNNNDSTQSREGAWKNWSGAVLSFSIIIIGRATSS